ncbi:ribonuclease III [Bacilliculturomica massiliensis]|uniref:ribonuclease III n=1 Tax=Bacilliculturomica massiliensis TaxID=1917867 RepID=UPI0010306B70|nr:ribonuclease III [Bacilliculturomica massiliensis]
MNDLEFAKKLGYEFRDPELLRHALTHSSFINESKMEYSANNERLEFLGDAFFDAIISECLYHRLAHEEEGLLTKTRAVIVCERSLMECGVRVNIGDYLRLGKGENQSGGRHRTSILADAMEAVIGAVYLDGGWEKARELVLRLFDRTIEEAVSGKLYSDYKTELQERLQARGEVVIHYEIEREEGPDHDKTFFVKLLADGKEIGRGTGRSKKEAEQHAARTALETERW